MTMKKISILFAVLLISLTACEDYLDRGSLDKMDDGNFWTSENNMRMYANGSYSVYFQGYGQGAASGNFFTYGTWSDEYASATQWTPNVATSGNGWTFFLVRRHNVMIERVEDMPVEEEAKNHWRGIGRFLRAMEYAELTRLFGDVPWFDQEVLPSDKALLFKKRDPMELVATKMLEDFEYAAANVRVKDGTPTSVNTPRSFQIGRDVVFAYMSRHLLYLGTYLKYHNGDMTVANTMLERAKWAAEQLITGGKYSVADDYRALFTSDDLTANKEVIFFRQYETGKLTHSLVSNINNSNQTGTTLRMLNTYLAADGLPIKQSPLYNYAADGGERTYAGQYINRDPRLAATLSDVPRISGAGSFPSTTGIVTWKFLPYAANVTDPVYTGEKNITDAPVMRYGEVLLNYAEAAAELGQFDQGAADKSINLLRKRNIKKNNTGAVLAQLPPMTVTGGNVYAGAEMVNDPDRDPAVAPLLWEIRRERAVELIYEGFRKNDLKRWNKFEYLKSQPNGAVPSDLSLGIYLDLTTYTADQRAAIIKGVKLYYPDPADTDHAFVYTLDGTAQQRNWIPGDPFHERQYLNSIPLDQITLYTNEGFELNQNPFWQ
jgi:starch-binding outer membrane protein, SusD/RagB family